MSTLVGLGIIAVIAVGAYYLGHSKGRLSAIEGEVVDLFDKIKSRL